MFTSIDVSDTAVPNDAASQFAMANNELHDIINEAINKLPEKSRQVYQLAWEENYRTRKLHYN